MTTSTTKPAKGKPGKGKKASQAEKDRERAVPLRYKATGIILGVAVIAGHWLLGGPFTMWLALAVLGVALYAARKAFRWAWRFIDKWGAREIHGFASAWEIHRHMSPAAVRRRAKHSHPHLARPRREHINDLGVPVGKHRGRTIAAGVEDFILMIAPPRAIKSLWLAALIMRWPGPAFVTSTRIDLIRHTIATRGRGGKVWTINPDGYGGLGSTLRWSPLAGCQNPAIAMQRAGTLAAAGSGGKGSENATFFAGGAYNLLRLTMHAAAVTGETIKTAARWASNPYLPEIDRAMDHPGIAAGWAEAYRAMLTGPKQTVMVFAQHAAESLEWLDDLAVAEIATAPPADCLDLTEFLNSSDTIYMVGPQRERASLAPYIACLAAALYETAKQVASNLPGDRLARKLLMALDEAAITVPVDLPAWSAEAGGWGVTTVATGQTPAGFRKRYGDHGFETIMDNASWKIIGPGITNADVLEQVATLAGSHDKAGDKHDGERRVLTPARIRLTKAPRGVVLHRGSRPLIVKLDRAPKLRGYQQATGFAFTAAAAEPEIDETLATVTELTPAAA